MTRVGGSDWVEIERRERGVGAVAEERGFLGKRRSAEAEDSFAGAIKGWGSIGVGGRGAGAREI